VDLRAYSLVGTNFQPVAEEPRSVYYEGFFFGLTLGF